MRKVLVVFVALTAIAGAALFAYHPAGAQGGGTIEASVTYAGAPVVEKLKVNKDTQQCGTEAVIEKVLVGANKGLANAVVAVTGAKGAAKVVKAEIDQHGCKFVPHVVAMPPGAIDIKNSDGILHNIHTYSTANSSINKAQPKFKKEMVEKFEKPELIRVQCDAHSWMLGWIYVTENPTAVTDGNGAFKLENVPPGKHKVEVVHPVLGKQTKEVEVKAGQDTKVAFELKK